MIYLYLFFIDLFSFLSLELMQQQGAQPNGIEPPPIQPSAPTRFIPPSHINHSSPTNPTSASQHTNKPTLKETPQDLYAANLASSSNYQNMKYNITPSSPSYENIIHSSQNPTKQSASSVSQFSDVKNPRVLSTQDYVNQGSTFLLSSAINQTKIAVENNENQTEPLQTNIEGHQSSRQNLREISAGLVGQQNSRKTGSALLRQGHYVSSNSDAYSTLNDSAYSRLVQGYNKLPTEEQGEKEVCTIPIKIFLKLMFQVGNNGEQIFQVQNENDIISYLSNVTRTIKHKHRTPISKLLYN